MEFTIIKLKQPAFIDIYGNVYRKCRKCSEIKMDYLLDADYRNSLGVDNICKQCKYKSDKRHLDPKRKEYVRNYVKTKAESTKEQRKIDWQTKRYKGQKTDIYIRKCLLSDKLFVTTNKNKLHIDSVDIKGDYASTRNCLLAIKKYGSFHKCDNCNANFDLRVKGVIRNKGNDTIKLMGAYCSKECSMNDAMITKTDSARRRRARYRNATIEMFKETDIYKRDKYKCYLCGVKVVRYAYGVNCTKDDAATIDHVIPLAKGGAHSKDNCKTCCRKCNSIKRDKVMKNTQLTIFSYAR